MTTMREIAATLPHLKNRARRLTKCVDDADDLLQNTFIRATHYADTFTDGCLVAWLSTMMFRLFLSSQRRSCREVSLEVLPGFDIVEDRRAEAQWDVERVCREITLLPPHQRTALELVAAGAEYEEIAQQAGIGRETVKTRIFRSRRNLERRLDYAFS